MDYAAVGPDRHETAIRRSASRIIIQKIFLTRWQRFESSGRFGIHLSISTEEIAITQAGFVHCGFGMVAKHESMNESKAISNPNQHSDVFVKGPAYPKTGNEVILELKKAMDVAERPPAQALDQKEFGSLFGAPKSTIHDWFQGKLATPIERLVCALERLSEPQRLDLFRALCRDCPRLQHPRLAHDPQAVNSLKGVLAQPAGLTWVTGPSDEVRTFVITAIGNSLGRLVPERTVSGIDVHNPRNFVPVVGVHYLRSGRGAMESKSAIGEICEQLCNRPSDVILLNGVWSLLPDLRNSILALAEQRTVIIADECERRPRPPRADSLSVSLVRVRSGDQANQIRIELAPESSEQSKEV